MQSPAPRILHSRWLLPAVLVVLAGHYAVTVPSYWFPWDEGSMAYTAERVLAGDAAHRAFTDTYTGGLNYLHDLVFWLFGQDFLTPRITLAISYLAGLAVHFWICRQLLPAYLSALPTLPRDSWVRGCTPVQCLRGTCCCSPSVPWPASGSMNADGPAASCCTLGSLPAPPSWRWCSPCSVRICRRRSLSCGFAPLQSWQSISPSNSRVICAI